MEFDVAVIGLGGMGSAIAAQCARRGARVLGLEQFAEGHELGSSSGRSRMIRKAYFEDAAYVPLVLRAYELWRELEHASGEELLRLTGLLTIGAEGSEIIRGTLRAAQEHGLAVDSLGREELRKRFPTLRLAPGEVALWETDGGVLQPERAIAAQLGVARRAGAELRFATALTRWEARGVGFAISLANGETVTARRLVLALGPWVRETLAALGVRLRVERMVQAWFQPTQGGYAAPGFPSFLVTRDHFPAPLYGFPDFGEGVKAAFHGAGTVTSAPELDREIDEARDIAPLVAAMESWMPGAAGRLLAAKVCMYSLTDDEHFVVDRHPEHPDVILCGGFSGHGFKFASVIGEIAAQLALEGGTPHAIDFLSLRRFRGNLSAA